MVHNYFKKTRFQKFLEGYLITKTEPILSRPVRIYATQMRLVNRSVALEFIQ